MIPVKLTIEGLYSYEKRQTIDFSPLTEAGLFGIFGAVGSGKSSILEAITFALYGETERLNKTDKRAYNMMNLKSSRSFIEFDFINHNGKLFRITREYKRSSRNFEKIDSASKTIFYERVGEVWQPLNHTDIQKVIGLTYDNFKRTIIIPQGKFREFIDLAPAERTRMLKEIYNLHNFDLQDNAKAILEENQRKLSYIEGSLKSFEEITDEKIKREEHNFLHYEKVANECKKEYDIHNKEFQKLKVLKDDFENLERKKEEFDKLKNRKKNIDEQEQTLNLYERIYNDFSELLSYFEKNKKKCEDLVLEAKNKEIHLQDVKNQSNEINKTLERLKLEYDNLPRKRYEETDLELIAKIHQLNEVVIELEKRIKKGEELVKSVEEEQAIIDEHIKNYEKEIEFENAKKIDFQILSDVGNWFINAKNITQNVENQKLKIKECYDKINEIEQKLEKYPFSLDRYEVEFEAQQIDFEQRKKEFETKKNNLEVKQKLAQYAHELHEGMPCPLCGSLEHPQIHTRKDVSEKIQEIEGKIEEILLQHKKMKTQYDRFYELNTEIKTFENQIKKEQEVLEKALENHKIHLEKFDWEGFSSDDEWAFEEKKKISINVEHKVKELMKKVSEKRDLKEKNQEKLQLYKKHLDNFRIEENKKNAEIETNKNNIKYLKYESYFLMTFDKITQLLEALKSNNKKVEEDYNIFNEKRNSIELELMKETTNFQNIKNSLEILENEQKDLNEKIKNLLIKNKINDLHTITEIISKKRNISEEREDINEFRVNFKVLNSSIQELEEKFKNIAFNNEDYSNQEQKFVRLTLELEEKQKMVTKAEMEVARLKKQLSEKNKLQESYQVLKKRVETLAILKNLFTGAGFVQYASFVYLRQLCDDANHRFQRMTKNQLSLQFSENGGFEVIDYLNEGRVRSVKTLSGGQYFQVALSLALALADSVQIDSEHKKRFFFIDEGFGTLDSESVNIVFETLNNLSKEHKIVGIISHVEELKERIPITINVIKDEKKGSIIVS